MRERERGVMSCGCGGALDLCGCNGSCMVVTDLDGFFMCFYLFFFYGGVMVVGGIERGSGSGLGFMWCVDQEKVVAMTAEVVAGGDS